MVAKSLCFLELTSGGAASQQLRRRRNLRFADVRLEILDVLGGYHCIYDTHGVTLKSH